jgi:hypothetical protein
MGTATLRMLALNVDQVVACPKDRPGFPSLSDKRQNSTFKQTSAVSFEIRNIQCTRI